MSRIKLTEYVLIIIIISRLTVITTANRNLCDKSVPDYDSYTDSITQLCGCKYEPQCVRKCCRSGFYHEHDENVTMGLFVSICRRNESSAEFSLPIYSQLKRKYEQTDGFIIGMLNCKNGEGMYQYFKMDKNDPNQKFFIQEDGTLYYPYYDITYRNDRYCVDELDGLTAYVCLTPLDIFPDASFYIHVAAKLVPIPFLVVTFLVYAILLESKLHNRAIMYHVLTLSFGFLTLAASQYYIIESDGLCEAVGFSIIYFMISSFLWMNVMCIDIWCAFSDLRRYLGDKKVEEKVLLFFSMYAWGVPAIMVVVLFLANTYGDPTSKYHPGVGKQACLLNGNLPTLLYYFVPILVIIAMNLVFFILTAINIHKIKKETSVLKRSGSKRHYTNSDDDKKYKLYWKLLFAMGINPVVNTHLIQTVSWLGGWQINDDTVNYIYYVKDFSHAMYGIVIFSIFVCKKNVWILLKKRFSKIDLRNNNKSGTLPQVSSSALPELVSGCQLTELRVVRTRFCKNPN